MMRLDYLYLIQRWINTYKLNKPFRLPNRTDLLSEDNTTTNNFQLNHYLSAQATQIYLMGDNTANNESDNQTYIFNYVHTSHYDTKLELVNFTLTDYVDSNFRINNKPTSSYTYDNIYYEYGTPIKQYS